VDPFSPGLNGMGIEELVWSPRFFGDALLTLTFDRS
jgi:hypothetical protein